MGWSSGITITTSLCQCPGSSITVRNSDVPPRTPISLNRDAAAFDNGIPSSLWLSMALFERDYIISSDHTIMYVYTFPLC